MLLPSYPVRSKPETEVVRALGAKGEGGRTVCISVCKQQSSGIHQLLAESYVYCLFCYEPFERVKVEKLGMSHTKPKLLN